MTETLHHSRDPKNFYERVTPFLLAHEAEHCLILGLTRLHIETPPESRHYFIAEKAGQVVGAAMVSREQFLLSRLDDLETARRLAQSIPEIAFDSAQGPVDAITAFAQAWCERHGGAWAVDIEERIYQLSAVIPVQGVAGRLRPAEWRDKATLANWILAFEAEAFAGRPPVINATTITMMLDRLFAAPKPSNYYLWDVDGLAVSMGRATAPTPNGIRIGPVYTPPEFRNKGYASACTAALSQQLLESGYRYCYLFTDLANPTSNHIYQTIGYQPVADVHNITFREAL